MRTLVLTALFILAGCGTAPPETTPPGSAAAPAAMPQQAAALGGEPKAEAAGKPKRQFKPPLGYKAKIVDWEILYCRKMVITGSRFPKEVCMTETQLKEHVAKNDEMRRDVNRVTRTCSSVEACGGI
jgi:hypothetical protein